MKEKLKILLSIPKSFYINLKLFKFTDAIYLPVIFSNKVKINEIHRGNIILKNWNKGNYRIYFGFFGSKHIIENKYSFLSIGKNGVVEFYGKILFGSNFSANKNCCFNCEYEIKIGDNVLLGWNINFRDTDGHSVFINNKKSVNQKKIEIGNHVWICSYVDVLKGGIIANDCVVAWRSCVIKPILNNNCLIGGYPAKILKENIKWKI